MEEFDNSTIRQFGNGRMEEWKDGKVGRMGDWKPDSYRAERLQANCIKNLTRFSSGCNFKFR